MYSLNSLITGVIIIAAVPRTGTVWRSVMQKLNAAGVHTVWANPQLLHSQQLIWEAAPFFNGDILTVRQK